MAPNALKFIVMALAISVFFAGQVAADHIDHDRDVNEPFATVGPLANRELPPQAVADTGQQLRRHGTLGFTSQKWAIDLPGRGRMVAQRKQQKVTVDGRSVTWLGNVEGAEGGLISITQRDDLISGFIDDGRRYWVIESGGKGLYNLFEIDTSLTPPPAPPVAPGSGTTNEAPEAGDTQAATSTVVQDILVVYTPEVTSRYGSKSQAELAITNYVAAINQSYSNSQVNIQLNLVGMAQTAQSQSGSMDITLTRLRSTSDGFYDEIHGLRDDLAADLVAMLTTERQYCGIGYLNWPQYAGEDSYAFSVTSAYLGYACLPLTLGHEVGHNQGLCHNREETGCASPAYPYGYGFRICGNFMTIMSYPCGSESRIYHFANPNVSYLGTPTGVAHSVDPENSAEAARALGDSALDVAAWRDSCTEILEPVAPSDLAIEVISSQQTGLWWVDRSTNESAFEIERSPDGISGWAKIANMGANAGSGGVMNYVDGGLNPATIYYYRVRAINCAGASEYSGMEFATTDGISPLPAAPSDLAAGAVSSEAIGLWWVDRATNELAFEVERSLDGINGWAKVATLSAKSGSGGLMNYVDIGLVPGTAYFYRVRATNDAGASDYSWTESATTDGSSPLPAAPTDLAAGAISSEAIGLWWVDRATNESAFEIERSPDGTNGWVKIATLGAKSGSGGLMSYADSGLDPGTTYFYRVRAVNGAGVSGYSSVDSATTDGISPVPTAPSDLAAGAASSQVVALWWVDRSTNEIDFEVERSLSVASGWTLIATIGGKSGSGGLMSYVDGGLTPSTTYYYRVRAVNGAGASAYSAWASTTTFSASAVSSDGPECNKRKKNCGGS